MSTPVEVIFRWRGEEGNRAIQETGQIVDRVTGLMRGLGREADAALTRVNRLSRDAARASRDYAAGVESDTKTRIASYQEEMAMLGALERARTQVFRGNPQGEYADVRAASSGRAQIEAEQEAARARAAASMREYYVQMGRGSPEDVARREQFLIRQRELDELRQMALKGIKDEEQARRDLFFTRKRELDELRGLVVSGGSVQSRADARIDPASIVRGPAAQTEGAMLSKFNAAARALDETEAATSRVSRAAVEGTKNVAGLAGIFTATTENGRKMRAVLYDIANQAGLPGVSRGLGVFGGAPGALIAGFVFLELARTINAASEEYKKINEEQLQFETNMANFGRRGGVRQMTGELEKLSEARRAILEISALGGREDPLKLLEQAGLSRPAQQREGIIGFLQRSGVFGPVEGQQSGLPQLLTHILANVGGVPKVLDALSSGFFSAPAQGASGFKNIQEIEQNILGGFARFRELEQINQRAGRETVFSKAAEGLGLTSEKQNDDLNRLSVTVGDLEGKLSRGTITTKQFGQEFRLLAESGRIAVDQLARTKLDKLNEAFSTEAFDKEALARGVTTAQLYAEKFSRIQKEVQAAKHQLEEFNREGDKVKRTSEQRDEFRVTAFRTAQQAFNQITADQSGGNPFLAATDKANSRISEFQTRFGGLGKEVVEQYTQIARQIESQDVFRAELASRERINQLLVQADELRNNEAVRDAERNRRAQEYLTVFRQVSDYQRQLNELRTGQPQSALQRGQDLRSQVDEILQAGLAPQQQAQAILEATKGLSRDELMRANVFVAVRESLATAATYAGLDYAFKRKTPEQQLAERALTEERAELARGFAQTPEGRTREAATLDAFLRQSALPAELLTGELRDARIQAAERRAAIESKLREDAATQEKQRQEIETKLHEAIDRLTAILQPGVLIKITNDAGSAAEVDLGSTDLGLNR
jgi:hypothetical protein